MSYHIYLYRPEVKTAVLNGSELDEVDHPVIPQKVRDEFISRLLKYEYEQESETKICAEFVHKNQAWSIQVSVFDTEIAFSVPYWDDAENAIFEAVQTAHELADTGELYVFDPQTGEWSE